MRWLTNDSSSEIDTDDTATITTTTTSNSIQTTDASFEDHTDNQLNNDTIISAGSSSNIQQTGNGFKPQLPLASTKSIENEGLATSNEKSMTSSPSNPSPTSTTQEAINATSSTSTSSPSVKNKEFKSTSEALIKKLLERSTPRLDAKLVGVLLLEDMMDVFMAHITRVSDNEQDLLQKGTGDLEQLVKTVQLDRDRDDLDALKRSYHAMEILCGTSAHHFIIQDSRFKVIVTRLFDIFSPNSNGNFNHFAKIFQHFVRRHPVDMLDLLFLQNDKATLFFDSMLPHIQESAVADSVLAIVFVRDINVETKEKRELAHTRLSELGLLQWLTKAIQLKNNDTFSEAAGELLIRIIEEASQVENGHLLLDILGKPDGGGKEQIDIFVKLVVKQKPSHSRKLTIKLLRLLAKSGMLTTRASAVSQPIHGPLYSISINCQEMLSNHIPGLCSVISDDRHSVSSEQLPLTVYDMDLLDIIYLTLPNTRDKVDLLDTIPTAFWRIVVNSFFEKSSSSIYHTLFFRIFCLALGLRNERLTVALVQRQKLVTRLINAYEDKKKQSDTRGFILLMLNYIRLSADADPTGTLHRLISDHPRYLKFLPTLRTDTLAQIKFNYAWKLDSCPRPPVHIGPSPPIRAPPYSSYTPTLQLTGGVESDETNGIDLGSDYAYCMGFDQTARPEDGYETPMGNLSRRTSLHSMSSSDSLSSMDTNHNNSGFADLMWGESLTADEPENLDNKKKKKKKKKKVFLGD
ncbi:hypothetical protein BC941DRAFT_510669 [Chlamydoabsidia padenii]|nr:hypothetical protein BC941DRAFT_510669 [Chlamydoabsidia padenii]